MKSLELAEANEPLRTYAKQLTAEGLLLTEDQRPVAALLPIDAADLESIRLGSNPRLQDLLERARVEYRAGRALSSEQVREELRL
ncbi:MAG: hypothetical protein KY476_21325 [Planctomycetes bacterium]|nr:hypothetical protein [Planctomycetota bacterium]